MSSVPVTDPVVAQRVGRDIALLFHDRGTRKGWVVSCTSRPYFTPTKDPVPIVQEAGWATGPVWKVGKSRPTGIRSPARPARSSVAIPTELPGPHYMYFKCWTTQRGCLTRKWTFRSFHIHRKGWGEGVTVAPTLYWRSSLNPRNTFTKV